MEEIESCIDFITHEGCRFFNESFDLSILFSNNNAIFWRVFYLSYNDGSLFAVSFMEGNQFVKRVFADNIRIENKE